MTKDLNKNILDIQYNFLNLPRRITFGDGSNISYSYDATGKKLRTVHQAGDTSTATDYCGNVIYENGIAKTLLVEGGYVSLSDNKYHCYIQGHQGNNCVVADENGNIEEVNHYYPFGGTFASTSSVQPYKYNGKELDRKGGLDWYDYGARHYDAAIGRWHVVDPMAEKYYLWFPYAYCLGNPVRFIDPTGMVTEIARFMDALRFNNSSILEKFNFSSWDYATDVEFTGNLTFNDETNTFYSSYGIVEDGVPTRVGVSVKASNVWEGGASIDGGKGRWYRNASGSLNNVYPEFGILTFARGIANLLYKGDRSYLFRYTTLLQIKTLNIRERWQISLKFMD